MTINALAEAIGVSPSAVSQFERGVSEPALRTLRACSEALGVPLFSFFIDFPFDDIVVRKDQRRSISMPNRQARYELLSPDLTRAIEMLMMHLEPGVASPDQPASHGGDECTVIIKGTAEVEVNSQRFVLNEGDSIYINEHVPHRMVNCGDSELICVIAITPASF